MAIGERGERTEVVNTLPPPSQRHREHQGLAEAAVQELPAAAT